jgi:hypothetical protein
VLATGVTAATAVVSTGTGSAQIAFSAAPESVTVSTGGGLAELILPGGPYALTTNSDGAAQTIGIATSSAAHRSITVTTGGGQLIIGSGRIVGTYVQLPGNNYVHVPPSRAGLPVQFSLGRRPPQRGRT